MAQAWGEPNQVVSLLLAVGASANYVDKNGFSALMMALGRNNEATLEQLIKAGADVQTRSAGTTPLHEAAGNHFSSGIRRLLALGADPDETDGRNRTPEQLAEECGFAECVACSMRRAGRGNEPPLGDVESNGRCFANNDTEQTLSMLFLDLFLKEIKGIECPTKRVSWARSCHSHSFVGSVLANVNKPLL